MEQEVEIGWDSVPVLQALDELCSALGKGRVMLPTLLGEFGPPGEAKEEEPAVVLDPSLSFRPVAYRDQFRAVVQDVEVNVCRGLESSVENLKIFLDLTVQPGSGPLFVRSFDVLEAIDDPGNSLILDSPEQVDNSLSPGFHPNFVLFPGAMPEFSLETPSFRDAGFGVAIRPVGPGPAQGAVFKLVDGGGLFPVSLKNPDRRARKLACLRLKVRLFVCKDYVSETLDMNAILHGPATARFGELSFTVTGKREHDVLLLKGEHLAENPKKVLGSLPRLELLDNQGKTVDALGADMESAHWVLECPSSVKSVRISAWMGVWIMEVPFEFRDIPLPER